MFALPGIVFSGFYIAAWGGVTGEKEQVLKQRYQGLFDQALSDRDLHGAELYFARIHAMSDNPVSASFEFAKRVYDESLSIDGGASPPVGDPFVERSLELMNALAPRQPDANGYSPAHAFLAEYWRSQEPQTDVTRVLTLQHEMYCQPNEVVPAVRLAEFIMRRGYYEQAITILTPIQYGHADVLALLATSYSKKGDAVQATRCLRDAESILRDTLQYSSGDVEIRTELSRVVAAQGRVLESMFTLVEGCTDNDSTGQLVDPLIHRYSVWLSMMPKNAANDQLQQIDVALRFTDSGEQPSAIGLTGELTLSTGRQVTLPLSIVRLHTALLTDARKYLTPLLLGTEKASDENWEEAIALLETANRVASQHPVVSNNLAWALFSSIRTDRDQFDLKERTEASSAQTRGSHLTEDTRKLRLQRAWSLSDLAVTQCSNNTAFRATRGKIAAYTKRWDTAVQDLRYCVDAGDLSVETRSLLEIAERRHTIN